MEFMGKKIEDIVVTLPFGDGTTMECGVYSYFEVNDKKYFALLPLIGEKELDFSQSYMLYEVDEDEENNPIIMYIEDDLEYAIAAQYFSNVDELWQLEPFTQVDPQKRPIVVQVFDVNSNFFKAQIEVVLSERKRQFSSYLWRKDQHVSIFSRSLAPF